MSDAPQPAGPTPAPTLPYTATPLSKDYSPMLRLGGGLGLAACAVGLVVLLSTCAGLSAFLAMSIVPVILAGPGLVVALIGAATQKHRIAEDTHVLLAVFVNVCGLAGGLVEMAVWRGWSLFPK